MPEDNNVVRQPGFEEVECLMPPSPELEERIIATQAALRAGQAIPASGANGQYLDLSTYALIKSRPPVTRGDSFLTKSIERAPITGTRKALVLLVDFSDNAATTSQQHYKDMMFSSGTYATGSMRDFYWEASYHKLTVTGEVAGAGGVTVGWFRAAQPKSYYTNNNNGFGTYPQNAQRLVEEAVDLASGIVNFADYDNDGDGIVDALVIIAAGSGAEVTGNANDIWSHKWSITPKTVDGVKVTGYFMAPEDGRVGVMSHELGHLLLGAPDLYDTDYSSRGTGKWDLMAGGSWNGGGDRPAHPVAWVKYKVGWVNPTVITSGSQDVVIPPFTTNDVVYKLPVGGVAASKEYFLVSNRQMTGFDDHLPAAGCCIEHCDDNQNNNSDETHYLVDIEQSDGKFDLNKNANSGDAGDLFPGSGSTGEFTDSTTPNSKSYSAAASGVSATGIEKVGADIKAKLMNGSGGGVAGVWHYNRKVNSTFTSGHQANAWGLIDGVGWRKVKPDFPDGVTNLFDLLSQAVAKQQNVHVYIENDQILIAYFV